MAPLGSFATENMGNAFIKRLLLVLAFNSALGLAQNFRVNTENSGYYESPKNKESFVLNRSTFGLGWGYFFVDSLDSNNRPEIFCPKLWDGDWGWNIDSKISAKPWLQPGISETQRDDLFEEFFVSKLKVSVLKKYSQSEGASAWLLEAGQMEVDHGLATFNDNTEVQFYRAPDRASLLNNSAYTGAVRAHYFGDSDWDKLPFNYQVTVSAYKDRPEFVDAYSSFQQFILSDERQNENWTENTEFDSASVLGRMQFEHETVSAALVNANGLWGMQGGFDFRQGSWVLILAGGFKQRDTDRWAEALSATLRHDFYFCDSKLSLAPFARYAAEDHFYDPQIDEEALVSQRKFTLGAICRYKFSNNLECFLTPEFEFADFVNDSDGKYDESIRVRAFAGFTLRY